MKRADAVEPLVVADPVYTRLYNLDSDLAIFLHGFGSVTDPPAGTLVVRAHFGVAAQVAGSGQCGFGPILHSLRFKIGHTFKAKW